MNDNVVRMYKGGHPAYDGEHLFAIKNGLVAPSDYSGERDSWLKPFSFGNFDDWFSDPEQYDDEIIASIPRMELIWEKQE